MLSAGLLGSQLSILHAVINADYRQSNTENQKQATANEIAAVQRARDETKRAEEAKQQIKEATLQSAQSYTDTIISLFGEESEAGQAALAVKKIIGVAEIALNLAKQLSANQLASAELATIPIVGPALAAAYLASTDAAAILAAAAQTATVLKLERGGIAYGPSHTQGGIPLYHHGRPAGIEIEGREVILTRKVTDSPLLLSLASTVNQLAGGRALVSNLPSPHMALGGITSTAVASQMRAYMGQPIDYNRLAAAMQKVNLSVSVRDTKAAAVRDAFTESQANS
jgi:hypothetical protein